MLSPSIDALTSGNCAQRVDDHLRDERRVGQLRAAALVLAPSSCRAAAPRGGSHFVHRIHVRRGVRADHHVLGDLLAHDRSSARSRPCRRACNAGMWPTLAAGARPPAPPGAEAAAAERTGLDETEDVVLGHAAADAGAADLPDVDVVLLRDPPHQRRRLLPPQLVHRQLVAPRPRGVRCRSAPAADRRPRAPAGRPQPPAVGRCLAAGAVGAAAGSRCSERPSTPPLAADHRDDAVDGDRLPFLDLDLGQHAGAGDGISASTLSVEISNSGSSRSTCRRPS